MEAEFYGANCIRLRTKKVSVVVDDYQKDKGKKIIKPNDIAVFTKENLEKVESVFTIDQPGEYEINDVSIHGIPALPAGHEHCTPHHVRADHREPGERAGQLDTDFW